MWAVIHGALWSFLAVVLGLVDFVEAWKAGIVGGAVGAAHATLQWAATSVAIEESRIVSRHVMWIQRVPLNQIEAIQRARHRRWSGVIVRLVDGTEIVLAAPSSSVFAPNPNFDEEVHRLCANIALGEGLRSGSDDADDEWL